jgi:hypothetical protein
VEEPDARWLLSTDFAVTKLFTTEDICSTEHRSIFGTYCDGKITYVTRLTSLPPEDVVEEIEPL